MPPWPCGLTMMPLAPVPIMSVPTKPKIGFSIDSIVGGTEVANARMQYPIAGRLGLTDLGLARVDTDEEIDPGSPGSERSQARSPESPANLTSRRSVSPADLSRSPRSCTSPSSVDRTSPKAPPVRPAALPPGGVPFPGDMGAALKGLYLPEPLVHGVAHPAHHHHHPHPLALAAAAQHFQGAYMANLPVVYCSHVNMFAR